MAQIVFIEHHIDKPFRLIHLNGAGIKDSHPKLGGFTNIALTIAIDIDGVCGIRHLSHDPASAHGHRSHHAYGAICLIHLCTGILCQLQSVSGIVPAHMGAFPHIGLRRRQLREVALHHLRIPNPCAARQNHALTLNFYWFSSHSSSKPGNFCPIHSDVLGHSFRQDHSAQLLQLLDHNLHNNSSGTFAGSVSAALGSQRTIRLFVKHIASHGKPVYGLLRRNAAEPVKEFSRSADHAACQLPIQPPIGFIHAVPQEQCSRIGKISFFLPLAAEGTHGRRHIHAAAQALILLQHNHTLSQCCGTAGCNQPASAAANDSNITGICIHALLLKGKYSVFHRTPE